MEFGLPPISNLVVFLCWSALYMWCATKPNRSPEWSSRVVTLLHGSVATAAGLSLCGVRSINKCRLTCKITNQHYALMLWSWGYFAFDLIWCMIYWSQNRLMICHHATALIAITVYMNREYSGCVYPCTIAFMEITNPLLQIRWFLRTGGYETSIIFYIVDTLYLSMFVMLRGGLGTYLVYKILRADLFEIDEKLLSVALYLVSLGLIYEIIGYIFYKYRSKIGVFEGYLVEMGIILNDQT